LNRRELSLALLGAATTSACTSPGTALRTAMNTPATEFPHVAWSRQASIYEVNLRQFTPEGTFTAFEAHLQRLAQMGVGILWFMPIQAIGVKNRKGGAGSYYSIRDYTAVNPEFGTLDDFRRVVATAHALGMKVILDWVANHTAWDHAWVTRQPDWYKKDAQGEIHAYTYRATPASEPEYWTDVVGLDYRNAALWPAMTDAMLFWLRRADIDGFRCDVASLVPTPFWEQARAALDRVKPVFMLAESDAPELHVKAFDMTYDWDLHDQLRKIAKGQAQAEALRTWWLRRQAKYPPDAYRMNFTGNHDSNSWRGSDTEFYGNLETFKAMAVLAALLPGMPLVYGGQEAFFDKRLQFFERDPIAWKGTPLAPFYAELLTLKKTHPALANGVQGGSLQMQATGNEAVFAFKRVAGQRTLRVSVNLSAQRQDFSLPGAARDALAPWAWKIIST
jgi:glycosidase